VTTTKKKIGIAAIIGAVLAAILALTKKAAVTGIKLSNLTIYPDPCNPGQDVTISVVATNKSNKTLTAVIALGGDFMEQQTVTLLAGQSQVVSFTVTPTVAKTYQVSLDGLSGSFVCTEVPVADIRLSDLVITPSTCYVGDTVTISVIATNYGTAAGSRTITCTVS
jgi:hypothetical protein